MRFMHKAILLTIIFSCIIIARPRLPKHCHLIELTFLGIPASGCEHAAVMINDLQLFNNRLYIGYGDAVVNTGPIDIISFDLNSGEFKHEFTVDEEGIYTYKIVDNMLMIPGIDATDDWHFGNIYVFENDTWIKQRSIPNGIHVNDLASFNGRLFASTGCFGTIGDAVEHYFGALYSSTDNGTTWDLACTTPSDDRSIFRITAILTYKDVLYAFPFAYTDMEKTSIPDKFHEGLSEAPYDQNKYLIVLDDIFGSNDVITFDNERWKYHDILPIEHVCYVYKPFVFDERLVLPVLSGEYIDYLHKKKHLIPHAEQTLYAFDGSGTTKIKFDFDRILDATIKKDAVYLLIQKDNLFYIVQSDDLKKWSYYVLPPIIDNARSVEYMDNTFFIGTESGNLFASQAMEPVKHYSDIEDCVPDKVYAEAELPRDGHCYWIAISGWQIPATTGRVTAAVKYGNIIKVTTDSVSRFSIFLPHYHVDPAHETTVIIDEVVAFEGMTDGVPELVCTREQTDSISTWQVIPGNRNARDYVHEKIALGLSRIPLTLDTRYPPVLTWKASVLAWAVEADGSIIPHTSIRKSIDHDTVYLEDIYDAHYRDQLCRFTATGQDISNMILHNIQQPLHNRCGISGFSVTFKEQNDQQSVSSISLQPEQTYTIVTTEFLAQRAEQYLGVCIEYDVLDYDVYDAIIKWFNHYHMIEDIPSPAINFTAPDQRNNE